MAKRRVLRETVAGCQVTIDSPTEYTIEGGSWETGGVAIDGSGYLVVFKNGYFDLSGYVKEEETLFCQSVAVQENPLVFGSGSAFAAHIVSTEPLNLNDFEVASGSRAWALPGNMGNHYSIQQIFSGRCSLYVTDSTVNSVRAVTSGQWGTGYSTAREKLYYAVAYAFPLASVHQFFIPDTTFVLPSVIDKEPDLEYIMRLKRSMELAE
jgi:hypothetical protein